MSNNPHLLHFILILHHLSRLILNFPQTNFFLLTLRNLQLTHSSVKLPIIETKGGKTKNEVGRNRFGCFSFSHWFYDALDIQRIKKRTKTNVKR